MRKFHNKILCGDCIDLLGGVKEPFADLVFADPPFNIGYQYDKYKDKLKKDKYIRWSEDWMRACCNVLKPDGSFYIAIGDEYAAYIHNIAVDKLALHRRNWIIWHYTFGQQTKNKFARAHTHIFYFVKDKDNFTFNDHSVRVPSDRQILYNDKRANPKGKMPDDVWNEFSRVCGTFHERQGWHPCQMPESVLARIISASSRPGDTVLDPFNGSGTTAAVAKKLGRNYCGIDISEDYVKNSKERLEGIKSRHGILGMNEREINELARLCGETGIPIQEIQSKPKLGSIMAAQLGSRMNNGKRYDAALISAALEELYPLGY